MEPGQFIPSDSDIRTSACQLFICIDYVCPDIANLIVEHQSTQDYIQYHIQRIVYQLFGTNTGYIPYGAGTVDRLSRTTTVGAS